MLLTDAKLCCVRRSNPAYALRGLRGGNVLLAVGEGFVMALLMLMQDFIALHGSVELTVNMASTLEVIRQIDEDEAHICLARHVPPGPKINVRFSLTADRRS